ncbi:sensor histidine kinase [Curtobacterium sp. B18]|uniref:sensor histidine kinase n=1 Tax=Curtobacterium sp. B18 TaxID=95614 RepID=UPI0011D2B142|nr:histidine kinase [Curtobacterium sp. B18]
MTAHVPPVTPRRRRPWSTRREWATWPVVVARIVLVVVAATLFAVAAPVTVAVYDVPVPLALLVTAVLSVSLGLAPVLPRTSSVAHLAAVAALGLLTAGSPAGPWPLPVTAIIGVGALLVVLGVRTDWRLTAAVWTAATVLTLALVAVAPGRWEPADVWAATFVVSAGSSLLLAGTAVAVGQRRAVRVELAEARRDVELEQARRRSVEERSRIARELHDVVAHSMSVVHMQAESAPFRVADLPPAARAEFAAIAETSRTALREMRQLLGTLRADTAAERAPQPGLDDLPALVRATQAAGIPVALQLDEGASGGTIDPLARLAAYRVVQEALGNVARHAPGAETAVTVVRRDAVLAVEVVNAAPPRDTVAIVPPDDGGFGLTGMRERVAALGGTIDHGPLPSGGFRVRVTLPCHPGTTTLRPQADRGTR